MSHIGHNSGMDSAGIEALRDYVDRVEKLEEEKASLQEGIKGVYAEAKAAGFDTKILRQVVQRRRLDDAAREEADALLELYEAALIGQLLE